MEKSANHAAQWHAGSLLQLSGSYWQTFTLHTAVKLGIFTHLAAASQSADDVAQHLALDGRGTGMLLNALCAMGLLQKEAGRYAVTHAAATFLDRASSNYIGHMIMHHHHLAETWRRMDEAVRSGQPLRSRAGETDEDKREAFLMGMYNIASLQAPEIAAAVDLGGRRHLLDLGGGPGTYAIYFCRHNDGLKATVFDRPTTRPFAEKTIQRHGLAGRIAFSDGDFTIDPVPGRYDVVWLSHILHAEGREVCEQIIAKVVDRLEPGGLILIHDFILDDTMDGPLFPALFALNMLQGTQQGQSYCQRDIVQMLERAGVTDVRRLDYRGPTDSGIIRGERG